MISLQDAVDHLYRVVEVDKKPTSNARLALLADLCVGELAARGVSGACKELSVPGIGRAKAWDIAWPETGKVRLGISLKSLLSNIGGSVPNRADELMGELANVQLRSPEIVTGYIMVFNAEGNGRRKTDGARWADLFSEAIGRLTGRDAPAWAAGMVEASAIVEVDFRDGPRIVAEPDMPAFFDRLAQCVRERNPDMFSGETD